MKTVSLTLLAASIVACRARGDVQWQDEMQALAAELAPGVEDAVGLQFKYAPKVAVRDKDDVREYLVRKLANDFPREEIERISLAYRLFGLLPPDLDLEKLFLDLYTEQIVGFYDPVTDSLYVVEGADPLAVRILVAHELVHALQAQYVPLDSLLGAKGNNDQLMASQAVLEGQGILAALVAVMPGQDFAAMPGFWQDYRESIRQQQEAMPVFSSAPLLLREDLIFPYLGGADFVRQFTEEFPDTVPFGPRLPQSTEQILHFDRYLAKDEPVILVFPDDERLVHQDALGEFETRVLIHAASESESIGIAAATGWDGDRYGVFRAGEDHALVWWTVWDTEQAARRFATIAEREWVGRVMPGRERLVRRADLTDQPAVLVIDAPTGWPGFASPPRVDRR